MHGKAGALYRWFIEPYMNLAIHGRPKLEVSILRTFSEYRHWLDSVSKKYTDWLRCEWFRSRTDRSYLRGYCAYCRKWTRFFVDHRLCSQFGGRSVPWWRETLTCPGCGMNARMRLSVHLLEDQLKPNPDSRIYLTEQMTVIWARIAQRFPKVIGSEFLRDGTTAGETNSAGIRCEDVTSLTFPDAGFDFVIILDVLEHVPDYKQALRECARVLCRGGNLLLTVPFHGQEHNLIRARNGQNGEVEHLEPPDYHGDPLSSEGCLCYYYFGWDLLNDLRAAGFRDAAALSCWSPDLGYLGDHVQFLASR